MKGVTRLGRVRNDRRCEELTWTGSSSRYGEEEAKMTEEMNADRLVKQAYEEEMTEQRPRGRSKKRWTDNC